MPSNSPKFIVCTDLWLYDITITFHKRRISAVFPIVFARKIAKFCPASRGLTMRILSGTGGYDKTGPGGEAGTGGWVLIKNAQRDAPSCNFYTNS